MLDVLLSAFMVEFAIITLALLALMYYLIEHEWPWVTVIRRFKR